MSVVDCCKLRAIYLKINIFRKIQTTVDLNFEYAQNICRFVRHCCISILFVMWEHLLTFDLISSAVPNSFVSTSAFVI